jgi:hypothetical protein
MIPAEDLLIRKVEVVLSELEAEGIQRYKQVHRSKAKIHLNTLNRLQKLKIK